VQKEQKRTKQEKTKKNKKNLGGKKFKMKVTFLFDFACS